MNLLDKINYPKNLKKLSIKELQQLSEEIRQFLINNVSQTGGHLASNLGVVELTLALHYVFDTPKDKIIWDVGHQTYVHKLITGRKDRFNTLRQYGGLSGFTKPDESEYDTYIAGHASTSLSLAAGTAVARDMKKQKFNVIAVIGDGAFTGGIAYEGLNNLGQLQKDVIIILNTNSMSISPNVGAIANYFNRIITGTFYNKVKHNLERMLNTFPEFWKKISKWKDRITEIIKGLFVPGILFEEMGFMYVGPEDGHNIKSLVSTLNRLKKIKGRPIVYHIVTKKGKGYKFAENAPDKFHGVSAFDITTGNGKQKSRLTYTDVFGKTIWDIGRNDKNVVAITAAMPDGTGLNLFKEKCPKRFFDVGIAEQYAVAFSAALASSGFKPVVAIYSTFLQRAYDQVIHDVAIAKLPVKFFLDRAGIVGRDGETHQGAFDISYLRAIPNTVILSPRNGEDFRNMIYTAIQYNDGPIFVRYPRYFIPEDFLDFNKPYKLVKIGKIEQLKKGTQTAIIATGIMVEEALKVANMLPEGKVAVFNIGTIKPINEKSLINYFKPFKNIIIMEENAKKGGMNEEIISILNKNNICKNIEVFALPDKFIEHGSPDVLRKVYKLTAAEIYKIISKKFK